MMMRKGVRTMQKMPRERLVDILSIQAKSGRTTHMRAHIQRELEEAGCRVWRRDKNLYARKGDVSAPVPVFIAHSDTVHEIVPDRNYRVACEVDGGDIIYYAYDPITGKSRGV